jgi:hypothetical protein
LSHARLSSSSVPTLKRRFGRLGRSGDHPARIAIEKIRATAGNPHRHEDNRP